MRQPSKDTEEVKQLNAAEWQLDLLKLNPKYVYWGCFEDYMSDDKSGWSSRVIQKDWAEHSNWKLDELNELVNFYFQVYRKNHTCEDCEGTGLNPATKTISDDWYDFAKTGRRWDTKITDVEVAALMESGRISDVSNFNGWYDEDKKVWMIWKDKKHVVCEKPEFPSADAVNKWAGGKGFGHDAINRAICVKARAEHLGVYGYCEHCTNGNGYVYDEPTAKVALQLWYIHPRKGCSRGVYIEDIKQEDLPNIFAHLKEAAKRNQKRFSKVIKEATKIKV